LHAKADEKTDAILGETNQRNKSTRTREKTTTTERDALNITSAIERKQALGQNFGTKQSGAKIHQAQQVQTLTKQDIGTKQLQAQKTNVGNKLHKAQHAQKTNIGNKLRKVKIL